VDRMGERRHKWPLKKKNNNEAKCWLRTSSKLVFRTGILIIKFLDVIFTHYF
jgi:hypothetical protein